MSPESDRPLAAYGVLAVCFGAGYGSFLAWRRGEGGLPERIDPADIVLLGVATHKVSRLVAKDKIAAFVRAPFAEPRAKGSVPGEVEDRAKGEGLKGAIGQLITCPHCLSMWVGAALTAALVTAPRETRLIAATLSSVTVADFLQAGYRKAARDEERVEADRRFASTSAG